MNNLFEVIDKTGRKIRLTRTQFEQHLEDIQNAIRKPLKVIFRKEGRLADYYSHFKKRKAPYNYLKVVVKCQEPMVLEHAQDLEESFI